MPSLQIIVPNMKLIHMSTWQCGPKMQPTCPKFVGSVLEKLGLFSPEVAKFLLVGLGSVKQVQKFKERGGKHGPCLRLTLQSPKEMNWKKKKGMMKLKLKSLDEEEKRFKWTALATSGIIDAVDIEAG